MEIYLGRLSPHLCVLAVQPVSSNSILGMGDRHRGSKRLRVVMSAIIEEEVRSFQTGIIINTDGFNEELHWFPVALAHALSSLQCSINAVLLCFVWSPYQRRR